jgi:cytochrome c oxidase assembly factor CtaG
MTLALTGTMLAIFGLTLQRSGTVLAARWWAALGQEDTATLLQNQHLGGTLASATGVLLLVAAGAAFALAGRGRAPRPTSDAEPVPARQTEKAAVLADRGV